MRKHLALLVMFTMTLTLLLSCRQTSPLSPLEPAVTLLSPGDGSIISGSEVTMRIFTQNFTLVDNNNQPNKAGEGHVIYYVDTSPSLSSGKSAMTSSAESVATATESYTWKDVPEGAHLFAIRLVNDDNTPLLPPVAVRVNVTVKR